MADKNIADQVKEILALKEDEEGNPVHYSRRTANIALKCIPRIKAIIGKEKGVVLGDPMILPYASDNIELYWTAKGKYDILANVKPDGSMSYYAEFYDKKPLGDRLD